MFNRTGVGHLISISGLHITMVAGLFAALASQLWRRSFFTRAIAAAAARRRRPPPWLGVVAALAYVLLAGFGVLRPSARSTCCAWSRRRSGSGASPACRMCCARRSAW
ncbi:ComEC/Rec2 family competence protein [Massilia sp. H-1]|nr:ComEC/Rec2 family competence protein [Massilia sp. H-1]